MDDDRAALDLLIRGFQVSRTIRLAADLGLADKISPETGSNIAELAASSGVLPGQLKRVVRALSAFGIFTIDAGGKVAHTPRSLLLRTDAAGSLHHAARFWTAPGSWRAWEALDAALTGDVPHEIVWGTSRFDYLREHPDEARAFDAFMANFPDDRHEAVATGYDFSKARLIADIGGGNGEALRRILALYPDATGVLFDRPDVVASIPYSALAGGRIATQGGTFFESVPGGADIYMLVRVLHDWPDEDALRILRASRAAMRDDARLLVIEALIPVDPALGRATEHLIDLQMMAMFGGARERTSDEFGELLAQAGFRLVAVVPTKAAVSILEAVPAS
jgi:O-methyltransferase domain